MNRVLFASGAGMWIATVLLISTSAWRWLRGEGDLTYFMAGIGAGAGVASAVIGVVARLAQRSNTPEKA